MVPSLPPPPFFLKGGKFNFLIAFGLWLLVPVGSGCLATVTQATIFTAEPHSAVKKGFGRLRWRGVTSPVN